MVACMCPFKPTEGDLVFMETITWAGSGVV